MREFGSRAVLADVRRFFIPPILAQKDLRRLAALDPGFSLDGFVVTAVLSFEPGFAARYDATPFALSPPDSLLPSFLCRVTPPELLENVLLVFIANCGAIVRN